MVVSIEGTFIRGIGLIKLKKSVLPEFILRPLTLLRKAARAQREHEYLVSINQSIRPELFSGAKLVTDRLALLDLMPKGSFVAEVGVANGAFAAEIVARTKPAKLHLIDPWDSPVPDFSKEAMSQVQSDRKAEIDAGIVELNRGYSFDVLPGFENDYFDWVYVDAGHEYLNVKNDLNALLPKVKPGGLICGHDYIRWARPTKRYGVIEAVNEFVNQTGSHFLYLTNERDKHDSFCFKLNK